ncbi:jg18874 [Pararge aegeria aegeria]|uniref:Jg18874 protein n=1 Tax=Pararge aegeria aegeria TaxID=348720 RepID=A0A8S4RUL1_9NEOP|nr:jg18874 [Pararge aegeria aegeria]
MDEKCSYRGTVPLVSMLVGAAMLAISGCGGCTLGPGHVVVPPQNRGLALHSAASRNVDASAEYSGIRSQLVPQICNFRDLDSMQKFAIASQNFYVGYFASPTHCHHTQMLLYVIQKKRNYLDVVDHEAAKNCTGNL